MAATSQRQYDMFLSYNRLDTSTIRKYVQALKRHSLNIYVDYEALDPGGFWIADLETAIRNSRTVVVFYGPFGFGTTQTKEIQLAEVLGKHIIPAILPGVQEDPPLSFLTLRTWVDLRRDRIQRLIPAKRQVQIATPKSIRSGSPYKGALFLS